MRGKKFLLSALRATRSLYQFLNWLWTLGSFLGRRKLKAATSIKLAACRLVMMAKLGDRRDEFAEFALAVNGISAWPRGTEESLESCNTP